MASSPPLPSRPGRGGATIHVRPPRCPLHPEGYRGRGEIAIEDRQSKIGKTRLIMGWGRVEGTRGSGGRGAMRRIPRRLGSALGPGVLPAVASAASVGLNTELSAPPRFDGAGYAVLGEALAEGRGYREIDLPGSPRHAH